MTTQATSLQKHSDSPTTGALPEKISDISQGCINCPACQKECAFLRKYGTPKAIADACDPHDQASLAMAYECSLCGLCAAVCPVKVNPTEMFLEMRREKMRQDPQPYPEHGGLLGYEKKGLSQRFTWYGLPAGCDTVFFPGCALPGTRPEQTFKLYETMKQWLPRLGVVLDCCGKISHDMGRADYFHAMFNEMKDYLLGRGVKKVIVACPNCYRMFDLYGEELAVISVYDVLAEHLPPGRQKWSQTVSIHDPCPLRQKPQIHDAVRKLATARGLAIEELRHSGGQTLCCGEGGGVGCLNPELSGAWGKMIQEEATGKKLLTYCAGCVNHLKGLTPTSHIIDFVFDPEATLAGKEKVAKAPITYLNRLKLKSRFKKTLDAAVTRERTFNAEAAPKGGLLKKMLLLGILAAAIFLVRYTGATQYLEQEKLRALIQGYGALAPVIYMLIYTLAPALLLPGLPITIAGGILFGPFWGVIYTITSATAGACVAFLVARYIARDWVAGKLQSPRWRHLDEEVERQGWKVVAFTRLIPAFPFNLLNYAFGLTKIKFSHYAITTFICMLPACIAFITFSSSLLDLIRGKVSPGLLIGIGLIVLVSLLPVFYKKITARREKREQDGQARGSDAPVTVASVAADPGTALKQTLKRKGFILLGVAILVALVVTLIRHYFYILDAYYYTAEFHVLFMINNIKSANLDLLMEYFGAIRSMPGLIAAQLLAYGVHILWLPFSKPVLVLMAAALYGPLGGAGISLLVMLLVSLVVYGLSRFFLGELVPIIRQLRGKPETEASRGWLLLCGTGFALPWVPILFVAMAASLIKSSLGRMGLVLAAGLTVRTILIVFLPGVFT
jgi:uncharacterized membrane protein YdjX (TVP38/TMEM64 family)/Fe-S oxidoreductase